MKILITELSSFIDLNFSNFLLEKAFQKFVTIIFENERKFEQKSFIGKHREIFLKSILIQ